MKFRQKTSFPSKILTVTSRPRMSRLNPDTSDFKIQTSDMGLYYKHCFQFLLGITMAQEETKCLFGGTNKEYYGIFRFGQYPYEYKSGTNLHSTHPSIQSFLGYPTSRYSLSRSVKSRFKMAVSRLDGEKICEVSGQVKLSSVERIQKDFEAGSIALFKLSNSYYVHAVVSSKRLKVRL